LSGAWESYYNFDFSEGLAATWKEIAWANQLIDKSKPWELVKTDPEKVKTLLLSLAALLLEIALKLSPVMPETAQKIKEVLESGNIKKPEPLFQKID
jgi:methionyl-tRNA synthetase